MLIMKNEIMAPVSVAEFPPVELSLHIYIFGV